MSNRLGRSASEGQVRGGPHPGRVSIPSAAATSRTRGAAAGGSPIIVYGDDYQDILAVTASKTLIQLGFEERLHLRGGIEQWIADGYDVTNARPPPDESHRRRRRDDAGQVVPSLLSSMRTTIRRG